MYCVTPMVTESTLARWLSNNHLLINKNASASFGAEAFFMLFAFVLASVVSKVNLQRKAVDALGTKQPSLIIDYQ